VIAKLGEAFPDLPQKPDQRTVSLKPWRPEHDDGTFRPKTRIAEAHRFMADSLG